MKDRSGFTLVEVIIAIVILTVGVLGLMTTAALVTRMIARGQRGAVAATFASHHMERLRVVGCTNRTAGSEDLVRGGQMVARTSWTWQAAGDSTHRVLLVTRYVTAQNNWRADTMETAVSCLR